jgi:hypothetical protein
MLAQEGPGLPIENLPRDWREAALMRNLGSRGLLGARLARPEG